MAVGAIVGMSVALRGFHSVVWSAEKTTFPYLSGMSSIVLSWAFSPILSGTDEKENEKGPMVMNSQGLIYLIMHCMSTIRHDHDYFKVEPCYISMQTGQKDWTRLHLETIP